MAASSEPSSSSTVIGAEIYDTDRFGTLYYGSRNPPIANLGLAAAYMISLFRRHKITFAFMGGWAVFLRGGQRSTQDIDLTVAGSMDDVKAIMLQEQRLCIPQIHGATAIQVFAWTGGSWDPDSPNAGQFAVSIDIIIGGNLGTPPDLPNGTEQLCPVHSTTQGRQAVPVIDLYYQVTTKLSAHYVRRLNDETKDFIDLSFLVSQYPDQIYYMRDYFNADQKWAFYTDFAAINDKSSADFLFYTLGFSQPTGVPQV